VTSKRRIHRIEASLGAKQKFFLWLHRAKAAGGFVPHWEKELNGPLVPFEWFKDEEAYFLFRLVNDVNIIVLKDASKNQDLRSLAHCALDSVVRQISRPDQSGCLVPVQPIPETATAVGAFVCTKFRTLLEEATLLACAIDVISKTVLGGEDILFPDTRGILDTEMSGLRVTAEICGYLADWLNLEPISAKDLNSGHSMVDDTVTEIVNISRAKALCGSSDLRKFKDAFKRAFPDLIKGGLDEKE
jgi:hypothetical protein